MAYAVGVRPAAPLGQPDLCRRSGPRLRGAAPVRVYPVANVLRHWLG